jgi:hypothetical protein
VKRTRGDGPIEVVIHICMEPTQGNSLCSYLYFKLEKHHVFLFTFYVFLLQNWKTGEQNRSCGGGVLAPVGGGKWQGKEIGG